MHGVAENVAHDAVVGKLAAGDDTLMLELQGHLKQNTNKCKNNHKTRKHIANINKGHLHEKLPTFCVLDVPPLAELVQNDKPASLVLAAQGLAPDALAVATNNLA